MCNIDNQSILADLTDREEPFGGKVIVLSGDFRQCLPIIPGACRGAIVDAALNRSHLWKHFEVMQLKENMRIRASGDATLIAFDDWTLSVGDGMVETIGQSNLISIPEEIYKPIEAKSKANPDAETEAMKN